MSKQTATASTIQITAAAPVLMLALELGEEKWKLGFSSAFGQTPLVRDIGSRDTKALLAQIGWAKKKLGLSGRARVVGLPRFRRQFPYAVGTGVSCPLSS
jgi:hypothetical protein